MYRKTNNMITKHQEMAELKASRIPTADILRNVGNWEVESTEFRDGITVTTWQTVADGVTYEVASMQESGNALEAPLILFKKGGPMTLPMHKLDFISQTMFDGDLAMAEAYVNEKSKESGNWLSQLAKKARAAVGDAIEGMDFRFKSKVAEQKERLLANELARREIAEERFLLQDSSPEPKNLSSWLLEEDELQTYRVAELWPSLGTVFLVAAYKAGKTTMILNVIRCLIDGGLFLGRFSTQPVEKNVGFLNFEVNAEQAKTWLKRLNLKNPEKLLTWNLKGYAGPMSSEIAKEKFVESLIHNDIEVLIIDPFSGIFRSGDANSNTDVKSFLLDLDEIVQKAGIKEALMAVHAGKDPNVPRGATTLGDHPDALWNLVKGEFGKGRYFKAEGRDVLVAEEGVILKEDRITLELSGLSKAETTSENFEEKVMQFLEKFPNCPAGALTAGITGKEAKITAARDSLVAKGLIFEVRDGSSKRYHLA